MLKFHSIRHSFRTLHVEVSHGAKDFSSLSKCRVLNGLSKLCKLDIHHQLLHGWFMFAAVAGKDCALERCL